MTFNFFPVEVVMWFISMNCTFMEYKSYKSSVYMCTASAVKWQPIRNIKTYLEQQFHHLSPPVHVNITHL